MWLIQPLNDPPVGACGTPLRLGTRSAGACPAPSVFEQLRRSCRGRPEAADPTCPSSFRRLGPDGVPAAWLNLVQSLSHFAGKRVWACLARVRQPLPELRPELEVHAPVIDAAVQEYRVSSEVEERGGEQQARAG